MNTNEHGASRASNESKELISCYFKANLDFFQEFCKNEGNKATLSNILTIFNSMKNTILFFFTTPARHWACR